MYIRNDVNVHECTCKKAEFVPNVTHFVFSQSGLPYAVHSWGLNISIQQLIQENHHTRNRARA